MSISEELFKGVSIIIDDALDGDNDPEKKDKIHEIKSMIEEKHIPTIIYSYIPDINIVAHLNGINFILLDWELYPTEISAGLGSSHIKEEKQKEIIEFISKVKEKYFLPIFIFTKAAVASVKKVLEDNSLFKSDNSNSNRIFLKHKTDIVEEKDIFKTLDEWLKNNSAIYTLKKWTNSLNNAKNDMFNNFFESNSDWPIVLWNTYKDDKIDMACELGELITKNFKARMIYDFNSEIYENNIDYSFDAQDIKKALEGEKYISENYLSKNEIKTGDLFLDKNEYYLNISPACDTVLNRFKDKNKIELLCLPGKIILDYQINNKTIDKNEFKQYAKNPKYNLDVDEFWTYLINEKYIDNKGIILIADYSKISFKEDYKIMESIISSAFRNASEYKFDKGIFFEKIDETIISTIADGNTIKFDFKKFEKQKFEKLKNNRIGRLLPPYIIRIQQRFSLYIQRQGLPRIPENIFG